MLPALLDQSLCPISNVIINLDEKLDIVDILGFLKHTLAFSSILVYRLKDVSGGGGGLKKFFFFFF